MYIEFTGTHTLLHAGRRFLLYMEVLRYILIAIFAVLGFGVLNSASYIKFRHPGLVVGGLSYLGGAGFALWLSSWWPLAVGFSIAFLAKSLGGNPGEYPNSDG